MTYTLNGNIDIVIISIIRGISAAGVYGVFSSGREEVEQVILTHTLSEVWRAMPESERRAGMGVWL